MARFGNPFLPSTWFEFLVDLIFGGMLDGLFGRLFGRFWSFTPVPRHELPELGGEAGELSAGTIVLAHLRGIKATKSVRSKCVVVGVAGKRVLIVPLVSASGAYGSKGFSGADGLSGLNGDARSSSETRANHSARAGLSSGSHCDSRIDSDVSASSVYLPTSSVYLPTSNYVADISQIYRGKVSWSANTGKQLRKKELRVLLAALRQGLA